MDTVREMCRLVNRSSPALGVIQIYHFTYFGGRSNLLTMQSEFDVNIWSSVGRSPTADCGSPNRN